MGGVSVPEMANPRTKIGENPPPPPGFQDILIFTLDLDLVSPYIIKEFKYDDPMLHYS